MLLFLNSIIAITAVAAGILLLKWVFRNKLSPQMHYYLWMLLVIRLLLTFFPQDFLPTYGILPTIDNVDINVQSIENDDANDIEDQPAHISVDIVFHNHTKSFSIRKNIGSYAAYIGFAGAALLFSFFLIIYFRFKIKLNKIGCVTDEALLLLLSEYKKKLNIKEDITIKLYGKTPMLIGLFKPVIILPEKYSKNDVRHMIMHELCHLKHHDLLLNILSTIFLCLNWYNPVIWLSCSAFRSDLEVLCDSNVLKMTTDKKQYATLLLNTVLNSTHNMPITTCMNSGNKEIKRRIRYMADFRKPNFIWTTVIILAITLLSVGCLSMGANSINNGNKWDPPFKGLRWGMSKAEVINALNLSENDVTSYEHSFVTNDGLELFGLSRNVAFGFQAGEGEFILTSIIINYSEEDLDTVQKEITKKLGEGEPSYYFGESFLDKNLSSVEWKSELLKDNPEHVKIVTDVVNSYPIKTRNLYLEKWSEMPLVLYQLNLNKSSKAYGQLIITGYLEALVDNPEIFKIKE